MKGLFLLLLLNLAFLLPVKADRDYVYSEDFDTFTTNSNLYPHAGFTQLTADGATNPIKVVTVDSSDPTNHSIRLGGMPTAPTYQGQDLLGSFDSSAAYKLGGSLEVDFTLIMRKAQTGDYFFALSPSSSATESNFFGKMFTKSDGNGGYLLGLSAVDDSANYGTDSLDFGDAYDVSLIWNFLGGKGKDTFTLSVDESDYLTETWTENGTVPTALTAFLLRQGSATGAPVAILDDLGVLAEAPEPSSLVLFTSLGWLWFLRRRSVLGSASSFA